MYSRHDVWILSENGRNTVQHDISKRAVSGKRVCPSYSGEHACSLIRSAKGCGVHGVHGVGARRGECTFATSRPIEHSQGVCPVALNNGATLCATARASPSRVWRDKVKLEAGFCESGSSANDGESQAYYSLPATTLVPRSSVPRCPKQTR